MKRLQILIDEDLHERLERQALEEGASKSALIRRYLRVAIPGSPLEADALRKMVGRDDFEPVSIDEVVYE